MRNEVSGFILNYPFLISDRPVRQRLLLILTVVLTSLTQWGCSPEQTIKISPAAADIFGDPQYRAVSFGGYRGLSRDDGPTVEQLMDDLRILDAMGVKLLRTYNTSQFPQVERLLAAISRVKQIDPDFEMYVMLGAWIDSKNAWTEAVWDAGNNAWVEGTGPDHTQGDVANNTREIEAAVRLSNQYPHIVKAIAVGNEAMVQWAVSYFVYPKTILKWVNYLQDAKTKGELSKDVWITSSDNYESWGGGNPIYHTSELTQLMQAVDFVSVHTYPFHDSFYNPSFWGVEPDEEALSFELMTDASMRRTIEYAQKQYQAVIDYMARVGVRKPVHIGETGWASYDESAYGANGSKAADEYKQKVFYDLLREWTDRDGISLFYFEAFDEQWKKADSPGDSENHFGLVSLSNEVKHTLWDAFDAGAFDGMTRNGAPLRKSYGGDRTELLAAAMVPPFRSQMAVRRIDTLNHVRQVGELVTDQQFVIVHNTLTAEGPGSTYPSASLKLTPWEGTTAIELLPGGEVRVETRAGDWWGAGLEVDADVGENLSRFKSGHMHFEIRGSSDVHFNLGFQTGSFLRGDQVNHFASFGPGTDNLVGEEWRTVTLPISELNGGADLSDVTNVVAFLSRAKAPNRTLYLRNIYFSQ